MSWQTVTFHAPRQPDRAILEAGEQTFAAAGISVDAISVLPVVGGGAIEAQPAQLRDNAEVKEILAADGHMVRTFAFRFSKASLSLTVTRPDQPLRDQVTIDFSPLNNKPQGISREQALRLTSAAKKIFKEIKSQDQLELFGMQVREHYDVREANLAALEATLARILAEFGENAAKQRAELENEFERRRQDIENETQALRAQLASESARRNQELDQRDAELKTRVAAVDDREAKHVRRKIREDMQRELAKRAESFQLTEGTRRLRSPVFWFALLLLATFGIGLAFYSWETLRFLGTDNTAALIAVALRQAAAAAGFGTTAVFFIRWNNRWFEQHASEEFKLKRLALDLDRASWVVELVSEWKEEKGTEIPVDLLHRLTANLFHDTSREEQALHPADQLATALLGTSAEVSIALPGGSTLKLDRKSLRELEKRAE
jgi:hypothetical protein